MDRLRYTYANNNNSNKLLNVNDISTAPSIRLGDFRTSPFHPQVGAKTTATVDYTYDNNGNLKKDLNKDFGSSSADGIAYNYLNLPEQITLRNASGGTKGTIVYTYSAAGAKLQKQVTDYSEAGRTITTTTQYIGASVLESRVISPTDAVRQDYANKILFLGHEEGRIRFEEATPFITCPAQPARIFYDYFLKDHLGNVRMVLTEQSETKCYGAATVEDATWATENLLYNIVDGRRIAKTVEPGASNIASFGAKFYRTNGANSNERTGLGIVLKVMKGDQVKITAESFYSIPGGNAGVPINMAASELLNALLGAKGFPVGKGLSSTNLAALNTPTSLQSFLNTNSGNSSLAKAAVNYALFDEQMRFVGGDYDPVPSGGGYKNHQKLFNSPVNITRSGYLYIYVSNESNLNVFFDNLNVSHTNGPILEETHYYPFGLTMAGISSKAAGKLENKRKFNDGTELENKEFSDASGLEWYATSYRSLDPQIGRFWQIDPFAEAIENLSPYVFANNNPIFLNDPYGLLADTTAKPDQPKCTDCPTGELAKEKTLVTVNVSGKKKSSEANRQTTYHWYQFFNDHNPGGDFLYELNKWNPLANLVNATNTFFTGSDTYGEKQSGLQGTLQLASVIPIGRLSTVIGNVSLSAVRQGIAKTLSIRNSISHIMDPKHNLNLLLPRAGSESNIIRRLYLSAAQSGRLPANGEFKITVDIYGHNVTISGAVIGGIPRIGTAYIK